MLVKERLEWIDVYKGIAIILMVIGHATGMYNAYIYQFHMAAFFFISGYVANNKKDVVWKLFLNRFFTLMLPLITFVLSGSLLLYILNYFGYCDKVFSLPFMGGVNTVLIFLKTGDIYIQYLGACWFLIVLFGVSILNKIIWLLSTEKTVVYAIMSLILYMAGYELIERGIMFKIGLFSVDLIFIAQFYYVMGYIFKNSQADINRIFSDKWKNVICLIITFFILLYLPTLGSVTVDYPSRNFNSPFMDMITSLNGVLLLYNVAVIVSSYSKFINRGLQYIGKNTIGILLYHFVAFKLLLIIFNIVGIIDESQVREVIPSVEVGKDWWLLFVVVSLLFSLIMWEVCKKIPVLNFMLGTKRVTYKNIINSIEAKLENKGAKYES